MTRVKEEEKREEIERKRGEKKRNGREIGIRRGRDMNMSNIQQSALQVQK